MNYSNYLETAKDAATKAGKLLTNHFTLTEDKNFKSSHDLVSEMDKESEKIILSILTDKFPSHSYFSEEKGKAANDPDFFWFIDPLDGTNNYVSGIPYFSVSISLLHKKETVLGVVFNPISKQLFTAIKNDGAYLNGKPIYPSNLINLSKSSLSFIKGHSTYKNQDLKEQSIQLEDEITPFFRRKITMWAPALDWCLVAGGGIDVLISFESELEDQYAGTLIAQESGINVVSFNGKKYNHSVRRIIASNNNLSAQLIDILKKYA